MIRFGACCADLGAECLLGPRDVVHVVMGRWSSWTHFVWVLVVEFGREVGAVGIYRQHRTLRDSFSTSRKTKSLEMEME